MTDRDQSEGREKNGADPAGKPDPATSSEAVRKTGERARRAAGPDGPDAGVIGETFKKTGG